MNADIIFKLLVGIILVWTIPQFRSFSQAADVDTMNKVYELLPSIGVFVILVFLYTCIDRLLKPIANRLLPQEKWSRTLRELKINRFVTNILKALYFFGVSFYGYSVLIERDWFANELGGTGDAMALWKDFPNQQNDFQLTMYFCLSLGYHFFVMYLLIVDVRYPDFWEDVLRAALGNLLISFSFLSNYVRIGCIIMLLHDACDSLICICKVLVDTDYTYTTVGLFCILMCTWAYLRLYCFSKLVLYGVVNELHVWIPHQKLHGWSWFVFCLLVLLLLNIYWFLLMLRMLWHFLRSGKTADMHSRISDMDLQTKYNTASSSHAKIS